MKALIIDQMSEEIDKGLKERGIEFKKVMLPKKDELIKLIPDVDVLIMRVDPFIDKDILDAAKNLKLILVGSVGTNHIDLEECKKRNIPVMNSPGQNSNAVAELVFSKALDLYRNTVQANNEVKSGIWNKYRWIGRELRNKTLGICGFGAIGRRVGEIANVFHMSVLAYDPFLKPEDIKVDYAKLVDFDTLVKESDIITLHMPLTPDTKDLFAAEEFEKMKDGACIINAARGGIVNEDDLYDYIKNGKLGGANLDTLSNELGSGGLDTQDVPVENKLFELDRLYVTPHIGGSTIDAQDDIGHVILKNFDELFPNCK